MRTGEIRFHELILPITSEGSKIVLDLYLYLRLAYKQEGYRYFTVFKQQFHPELEHERSQQRFQCRRRRRLRLEEVRAEWADAMAGVLYEESSEC